MALPCGGSSCRNIPMPCRHWVPLNSYPCIWYYWRSVLSLPPFLPIPHSAPPSWAPDARATSPFFASIHPTLASAMWCPGRGGGSPVPLVATRRSPPEKALSAAAIQISGSNLVLATLFAAGLLLSLTTISANMYYRTDSVLALVALLASGVGMWFLTRHPPRTINKWPRSIARRIPPVNEDWIETFLGTMAERLLHLVKSPAGWAWIYCSQPRIGFGTPAGVALLGVIGWRLVQFWMHLPSAQQRTRPRDWACSERSPNWPLISRSTASQFHCLTCFAASRRFQRSGHTKSCRTPVNVVGASAAARHRPSLGWAGKEPSLGKFHQHQIHHRHRQ